MLTELFLKLTYVGAEWVLWLLVVLSIVSIALIVERCLYFFRTRAVTDEIAAKLHEELRAGKVQNAWQLVKDSHTFLHRKCSRRCRPRLAAQRRAVRK